MEDNDDDWNKASGKINTNNSNNNAKESASDKQKKEMKPFLLCSGDESDEKIENRKHEKRNRNEQIANDESLWWCDGDIKQSFLLPLNGLTDDKAVVGKFRAVQKISLL